MSKSTTGRQMLEALEKRLDNVEGNFRALVKDYARDVGALLKRVDELERQHGAWGNEGNPEMKQHLPGAND